MRCFGMFTQRCALIFTKIYGHNSERHFPPKPALLSHVHFCNYKINISQPVNDLYHSPVQKKSNQDGRQLSGETFSFAKYLMLHTPLYSLTTLHFITPNLLPSL